MTATRRARWSHHLAADHRAVVELARRPVCLAEIGAALTVPVTVAYALVHDLVDRGFLHVHPPFPGGCPPPAVLGRLLEGLRAR